MIEIDEPPDIRACARHQTAVGWLWSKKHNRPEVIHAGAERVRQELEAATKENPS